MSFQIKLQLTTTIHLCIAPGSSAAWKPGPRKKILSKNQLAISRNDKYGGLINRGIIHLYADSS
jgi:hypothetical protein